MKEKIFEVKEIEDSENHYLKKEKQEFKGWIKTNWLLILVLIVAIASILLNISQYFWKHNVDNFLKMLFLNNSGEFQWAGITAFVAIVSFISTVGVTIHKNRADLVSKSRIDWLQKNKQLMSDYLEEVSYYPYLFIKYKNKKTEEVKEELDDLSKSIETREYLLLLNLSDNEDNKQINKCINDCISWINSMKGAWKNDLTEYQYETTPVTNLLKISRAYYKREWDKAKRGK